MAKIDLNAVLDGHDNPRVGDEYEVAPGKWGKLRVPTIDLQEKVLAMLPEDGAEPEYTDLDITRLVLEGLPDFDPKNAISGMTAKVVHDFFSLLLKTSARLTHDLEA